METDNFKSVKNQIVTINELKYNISNFKKIFYIFIILILLLNTLIFSFLFIRNSIFTNNLQNNINITYLIENITSSIENKINADNNACILVKNKLKNRILPFDFEDELMFFIDLISCNIPFSLIRFADGENSIMKGIKINAKLDKWYWDHKNKKFQESLIESASICTNQNSFIGIPCKNWFKISESILSFSKCSTAKFMSYSSLFVNKNYPVFKDWIIKFINSSNRSKIILVANSIINKNITWAYKFFPVPDHLVENWDNYSISLLSELSHLAKQNNFIFFISAGAASKIIISYLTKINSNNTYIDFGSSIEFITKGYTTRTYAKNGDTSHLSCEPFFLQNKSLIYIDQKNNEKFSKIKN